MWCNRVCTLQNSIVQKPQWEATRQIAICSYLLHMTVQPTHWRNCRSLELNSYLRSGRSRSRWLWTKWKGTSEWNSHPYFQPCNMQYQGFNMAKKWTETYALSCHPKALIYRKVPNFWRVQFSCFFMDGFSITKVTFCKVSHYICKDSTVENILDPLRVLTKDITSPAFSSANIEMSCILQSKRQQPICRCWLKTESYAKFKDEQLAEVVNWE